MSLVRFALISAARIIASGCGRLQVSYVAADRPAGVAAAKHDTHFVYHYPARPDAVRHGVARTRNLRWLKSKEPVLKQACDDGLCASDPRWNLSTF